MQGVEQEKRAHLLSARVISLVDTTRLALEFSDPERRMGLLSDLQEVAGLHLEPHEATDAFDPPEDSALLKRVLVDLRQRFGPATLLASRVNQVDGFWVSFAIDSDAYWLRIDLDLLRRDLGRTWILWAGLATLLSLIVTAVITRVLNRPLAQLSRAAAQLGQGKTPTPLPDSGPIEIRRTNAYFNRMVDDLQKLEQDRALLLAGISHDLRTPLTRLRLEMELANLPEATRHAMEGDIEQMDQIVQQFLDYAQPGIQRAQEELDLSALMQDAVRRAADLQPPPATLTDDIEPGIFIVGYRTELLRAIDNLIENAYRYSKDADGKWSLQLSLHRNTAEKSVSVVVADQGPGIAPEQLTRLVRPFERGESARSGPPGVGMGLAIIERIVKMHHGQIAYGSNHGKGLQAQITLPVGGFTPAQTQFD